MMAGVEGHGGTFPPTACSLPAASAHSAAGPRPIVACAKKTCTGGHQSHQEAKYTSAVRCWFFSPQQAICLLQDFISFAWLLLPA